MTAKRIALVIDDNGETLVDAMDEVYRHDGRHNNAPISSAYANNRFDPPISAATYPTHQRSHVCVCVCACVCIRVCVS